MLLRSLEKLTSKFPIVLIFCPRLMESKTGFSFIWSSESSVILWKALIYFKLLFFKMVIEFKNFKFGRDTRESIPELVIFMFSEVSRLVISGNSPNEGLLIIQIILALDIELNLSSIIILGLS